MNATGMVTAVKAQVGFDTSGANVAEATILSWVNAKYREFCAKSKWTKGVVQLEVADSGLPDFKLPVAVSEISTLWVGESEEYTRLGLQDLRSLALGKTRLARSPGAYAPNFIVGSGTTADSTQLVRVWPEPAEDDVVEVEAVIVPPALAMGEEPLIPEDFHEAIVDGAIALGLERTDGRFDLSQSFNAKFDGAVTEAKARATARVGQGPVQFGVAGVHF